MGEASGRRRGVRMSCLSQPPHSHHKSLLYTKFGADWFISVAVNSEYNNIMHGHISSIQIVYTSNYVLFTIIISIWNLNYALFMTDNYNMNTYSDSANDVHSNNYDAEYEYSDI